MTLPKYTDVYEITRYHPPQHADETTLPVVFGFRAWNYESIPTDTLNFAFLETKDEVNAWLAVMDGPVATSPDGSITDAPLLKWHNVPSLLTDAAAFHGTFSPETTARKWPLLGLQTLTSDEPRPVPATRDRYYYDEIDKEFQVL